VAVRSHITRNSGYVSICAAMWRLAIERLPGLKQAFIEVVDKMAE